MPATPAEKDLNALPVISASTGSQLDWTVESDREWGSGLEGEAILTESTFDADLVPNMTSLTPSTSSESGRSPATESGSLSSNSTPNGSSPPAVDKEADPLPPIKPGRRLDVELQDLFGESRAGKVWRAAAYLYPDDVRIPTECAVSRLTDHGHRAFRSTSSHQARLLVNIRAEKPCSGPAGSSQAVCIPCWSGPSDSPRTSPPRAPRSIAQTYTSNSWISVENGRNHCTVWPSDETRITSGLSSCPPCDWIGS
jgi:hypothetical protein